MGDDVSGPSSLELGYLRREPQGSGHMKPRNRPAIRRRWFLAAALVGALVILAVALVPPGPERPEIAAKAVGSWHEIDTPQHSRLVLRAEGDGLYHVIYARVDGDHAVLRGDTLVIVWGGNDSCTLIYDGKLDRLTAATGSGTFTLVRLP